MYGDDASCHDDDGGDDDDDDDDDGGGDDDGDDDGGGAVRYAEGLSHTVGQGFAEKGFCDVKLGELLCTHCQ